MKKLSAKLLMALLLISFTTTTISAADWGLFELKGKVKSVTYYNGACHIDWEGYNQNTKITFSNDGKVNVPKGLKVIRNKQGHITEIQYISEKEVRSVQRVRRDSKERITYLSFDRIDACGSYQYNYTYNSKGYISKAIYETWEEGCTWTTTFTYTYQDFDENGNWTKRSFKAVTKEDCEDGKPSTSSSSGTETRKITYHKTTASKDKKTTKSSDSKKSTKSTDSKKSSKSKDSKKSSSKKDSKKSSSSKSKSSKSSKK